MTFYYPPPTRRGLHACGCGRLFAGNISRSDARPKPCNSKPRTRKIRKTQVPTPVSLARRLLLSVADHIYGRRGVAGETSRQMFPIISLAAAPEKAFAKTRVFRRVRCTPHPQAFPGASLKRHRFFPPRPTTIHRCGERPPYTIASFEAFFVLRLHIRHASHCCFPFPTAEQEFADAIESFTPIRIFCSDFSPCACPSLPKRFCFKAAASGLSRSRSENPPCLFTPLVATFSSSVARCRANGCCFHSRRQTEICRHSEKSPFITIRALRADFSPRACPSPPKRLCFKAAASGPLS